MFCTVITPALTTVATTVGDPVDASNANANASTQHTPRDSADPGKWIWRPRRTTDEAHPRPWLGVAIEPVPAVLRAFIDLPEGFGLVISYVVPEGPADKAGLQENDILLTLNDQQIVNHGQLTTLLHASKKGDTVTLGILRKGENLSVPVVVGEHVPRHGEWIPKAPLPPPGGAIPPPPPGVPLPPPQPGAAVDRILESVQEFIPGSVRVIVDDEQRMQVDLDELKVNLRELREKLRAMDRGARAPDISRGQPASPGREAGRRRTTIHAGERSLIYTGSDGLVRIRNVGGRQHATVLDASGEVLFHGPLPDDYRSVLDQRVLDLIDRLHAAQQHIDESLEAAGDLPIEMEIEQIDPLSLVAPQH
jgi:hypothetical protein